MNNGAPEHTPQDHEPKGPEVYFLDAHTAHEVRFHAPWESTLQTIWDQAYLELEESRRPGDELQCRKDGVAMTPYLSLALRELQERHICPGRQFQIHGESGGAFHE